MNMIMNLKIDGLPEEIMNELVHKGIASNKSEAIRLALLHYNEHFGIKNIQEYIEDQAVIQKIRYLEKESKEGKRKTLSEDEALAKYKHLLK